jgi:hypothetical protein
MSNRKRNADRRIIPTRFLPRGAKRITNADNERVWLIGGQEFLSKAEYFKFIEDQRLATKVTPAEPKAEHAEAPQAEPVSE